jgi:ABC-type uncharacterized transport system permease subunit
MDKIIAIVSSLFYCLAIATIVPGLVHKTGIKAKAVFISAVIALILHGWLLTDLIFNHGGQNLTIVNVASIVSFIISLVMTITMTRARLWFMLPLVYSFGAIIVSLAAFLPGTFITHLEHNAKLTFHISLALFSYSTLTIAAIYALQLAWLDYKLKQKKALAINPNLPPLLMIERKLFHIILVGYLLLTGTVLTGFFYISEIFGTGNGHKAVFSFIAWMVYSVLLWGHYRQGWRGRKVTWYALGGVTLLTIGYFGSRLIRELILH